VTLSSIVWPTVYRTAFRASKQSVTNSDCDSAEWKDIGESDLDSQARSDLESQSFLPDGDDIAFPSDDELGDNSCSDSDEGLIDCFEPKHLDFSDD